MGMALSDGVALIRYLMSAAQAAPAAPQAHQCPGAQVKQLTPQPAHQCPSARIKQFARSAPPAAAEPDTAPTPSALSTWPIQIRLVPPTAPFLQDAHVLVAADCVPAAAPNFHRDFLQGRVLMMGCPKFDDAEPYVQKFAQIFASASVKRVTVAVMQVPCCQGLPAIVRKGMEIAGKAVPGETVALSLQGEVLDRRDWQD